MRRLVSMLTFVVVCVGFTNFVFAGASKTTYPVIFCHGAGFSDNNLGYPYWSDDGYPSFVGDPCDSLFEINCNSWLHDDQKAHTTDVAPVATSWQRGEELAEEIKQIMTANGYSKVNLVGHSQGALDVRRAAKLLYYDSFNGLPANSRKVACVITISGVNRGNELCKYILDNFPINQLAEYIIDYFGNIISPGSDNQARECLMNYVWQDYDPNDGKDTSIRYFNEKNNINYSWASFYGSIVTNQDDTLYMNPACHLSAIGMYYIDGDGSALSGDPNGDGGFGNGDGSAFSDGDDDGVVPLNKQQIGYRLKYTKKIFGLDEMDVYYGTGIVTNVNQPSSVSQVRYKDACVDYDHFDIVGMPENINEWQLDEEEFYAALINRIAALD